jgi:hypothetical protein
MPDLANSKSCTNSRRWYEAGLARPACLDRMVCGNVGVYALQHALDNVPDVIIEGPVAGETRRMWRISSSASPTS